MPNLESRKLPEIAVIGFSRQDSPIDPLWPGTHRALLPIAGKPAIMHLIEQLADCGIRHVRVAGSIQQYAVRSRLRCGREWGVTIRYSDLGTDELVLECLANDTSCLMVYGDHLHDIDFQQIANRPSETVEIDNAKAMLPGIWGLENDAPRLVRLVTPQCKRKSVNPLSTPMDFLRANVMAAGLRTENFNVPGAPLHPTAIVDWDASVSRTAGIGKHVFVGKHCHVGALARLDRRCVLSNGVFVASGARLSDVVVLPNTYVGPLVRIRRGILSDIGLLAMDGRFWPVRDQSYLGATRSNCESRTGVPDRYQDIPYLAPNAPLSESQYDH
ncbi:MAG: NDP-sugar synthase [Pseudomonadota bacterium]